MADVFKEEIGQSQYLTATCDPAIGWAQCLGKLHLKPACTTALDVSDPYMQGVGDLNNRQKQLAATHPNLMAIDCGQSFLMDNGAAVNPELLPDGVHPSTEGAVELAKCMGAGIQAALRHG